ncbi:unnamed protein product [Vitrella brassicaformis CCMP3155]|uniref:Uncharacterized protein n=1 Tax=Vitrella brassicaformis (strain CCMP3155) TaxID=1169540 RepID=A0A0G4GY82_VITBC|nr:unnamed protein product [Vitrella brassicaformis CCMP3155]|eukprot:CEM35936.1 unnamed protein product [Vitrella brassicaformis CCMP3155]
MTEATRRESQRGITVEGAKKKSQLIRQRIAALREGARQRKQRSTWSRQKHQWAQQANRLLHERHELEAEISRFVATHGSLQCASEDETETGSQRPREDDAGSPQYGPLFSALLATVDAPAEASDAGSQATVARFYGRLEKDRNAYLQSIRAKIGAAVPSPHDSTPAECDEQAISGDRDAAGKIPPISDDATAGPLDTPSIKTNMRAHLGRYFDPQRPKHMTERTAQSALWSLTHPVPHKHDAADPLTHRARPSLPSNSNRAASPSNGEGPGCMSDSWVALAVVGSSLQTMGEKLTEEYRCALQGLPDDTRALLRDHTVGRAADDDGSDISEAEECFLGQEAPTLTQTFPALQDTHPAPHPAIKDAPSHPPCTHDDDNHSSSAGETTSGVTSFFRSHPSAIQHRYLSLVHQAEQAFLDRLTELRRERASVKLRMQRTVTEAVHEATAEGEEGEEGRVAVDENTSKSEGDNDEGCTTLAVADDGSSSGDGGGFLARFDLLYRQYYGGDSTKARTAHTDELFMDRLTKEWPHINTSCLRGCRQDYEELLLLAQHHTTAIRQHRRHRWAMLKEARHEWQTCIDDARKRQEANEHRAKQRAEKDRLTRELADRRVHFLEKQWQKQRREAALQKSRAEEAAAAEAAWQEHAARVKQAAMRFREVKEQRAAAEEVARHDAEREAAELLRHRHIINSLRLCRRREIEIWKQEEADLRKQAAEQQAADRQARLARALQKFAVIAPNDPARLLKSLECHEIWKKADDPHVACLDLFPMRGFSEAALMKDTRYKLSAALQNAGLYGSSAGRSAMLAARPAQPARPDTITQPMNPLKQQKGIVQQ